jgi:GntR family transcriptional regulator, transcriptional repressor for pyruvate dehydrogenase complex
LFHRKLVELTGIQTLILLTSLLDNLIRQFVSSVVDNAGRQLDNSSTKRKVLKAEEKLVTFVEQRDGAGAEAYWRNHLVIAERIASRWQPMESVIDLLEPRDAVKIRGVTGRS